MVRKGRTRSLHIAEPFHHHIRSTGTTSNANSPRVAMVAHSATALALTVGTPTPASSPSPRPVLCAEGIWCSRVGVAAALRALAPQLSDEGDVPAALDFLIGSGLADADEKVREEMVAAGGAGKGGRGWCWLGSGCPLAVCVLTRVRGLRAR